MILVAAILVSPALAQNNPSNNSNNPGGGHHYGTPAPIDRSPARGPRSILGQRRWSSGTSRERQIILTLMAEGLSGPRAKSASLLARFLYIARGCDLSMAMKLPTWTAAQASDWPDRWAIDLDQRLYAQAPAVTGQVLRIQRGQAPRAVPWRLKSRVISG
jgi:hypothetical protein